MTVREIRLYGDPVLRTVCDPILEIDGKVKALVEDLVDTTKLPGRAGVAAHKLESASEPSATT
jgi:peptide deformylase